MKKTLYTIGVDIGGSKIGAVLWNGEKVVADSVLATPKDNISHFLIMLGAALKPLFDRARVDKAVIAGLGLGFPGILNLENGRIGRCPNIPLLDGFDLKAAAEKEFSLPAEIDNDSNCFAFAEALFGAGKGHDNVFGITVGTGIGGGWFFNNSVYQGAHGAATEPGSMIVDFSSGKKLEAVYHEFLNRNANQLADKAYRGDLAAEKAYAEFGRYLGISLANITNIIDPEIFVVGGGVSEAHDLFLPQTRAALKEFAMSAAGKKIKIVKSKLGREAGAIGAALLVKRG